MKRTEFTSDNSGGLRKIVVIPESSFAGVNYASDGSRVLSLINTDNIIILPCQFSDSSYQENKTESDNGDVYTVEIGGIIYGSSSNNSAIIQELDSGVWIVATEDAEGNWIVFGSKRVRLVFERKKETGSSRSSLKGTTFSFSCEDEYSGIIIQPPLL